MREIIWGMKHSSNLHRNAYVKVGKKLMNEMHLLREDIMVMGVVYLLFLCRRLVGQHIEE